MVAFQTRRHPDSSVERSRSVCQHLALPTQIGLGGGGSDLLAPFTHLLSPFPRSLCEEPGCQKSPYYGWPDSKRAILCAAHKKEGMTHVAGRRCSSEGCKKVPYYGYVGTYLPVAHFLEHIVVPDPWRSRRQKARPHSPCPHTRASPQRPVSSSFLTDNSPPLVVCPGRVCVGGSFEGSRATMCSAHRLPQMVDVVSKRCGEPNCRTQPCYGMIGEAPTFCAKHKKEGMTNVVRLLGKSLIADSAESRLHSSHAPNLEHGARTPPAEMCLVFPVVCTVYLRDPPFRGAEGLTDALRCTCTPVPLPTPHPR